MLSSCSNRTNENTTVNENSTEKELQPIEVVELFINSLGDKDFETAYDLQNVKSWGDYQQFSSTKSFGGINATAINEITEIEENTEDAKIYVDAYYYDPVNGDNRFQQYFHLKKFDNKWKIEKLEQTTGTNKNPEEQISEILSQYTFFDNSVSQSKNENTIYSYSLPNTDKLYIVFTSNEYFGGHFSYSYMSVFVFNIANKLKNKFAKSYEIHSNFGSYAPDKESLNIYEFDNEFIILIDWGYTQNGITEVFSSMYYIKNNNLLDIGNIQTHFDNLGMYSWEDEEVNTWDGEIRFQNTKTNILPDIELYYVESTYNDADAMKFKYFSFNGTKYIEK